MRAVGAVLVSLLAACGAPRVSSAPRAEGAREFDPPVASDPSSPPTQYRLTCRDRSAPCPEGVGLFVRPADPDAQRCTAVLVARDRVLTASHCLAAGERHPGASCGEIWIGFTASGGAPMQWSRCAEVVVANAIDDASVMQRDVAMLRLTEPVARTVHSIDARAPEPGSIVSVVAVRPHPIYPLYHELYERLCRVATRESAVEAFGDDAARVGWLMDCPSHGGNSGAPVLDARGRVRALLHGGSPPLHGVGVTSSLE